ncbi:Putative flagellar filament outer layer-like protein [Nocardia seriolae]|uniref:Flagellar filament outer layer-like protein n=2 Tax=Nocardia seriolae TaxID=37332 RepID=A0ABC8B2C2_9NOCA|nr:Putative flagellar filament outer layer-like protein [Nocardia seriolae]
MTEGVHTVKLYDFGEGDSWTATGRPAWENLEVRIASGSRPTSDSPVHVLGVRVRTGPGHRGYNIFELVPPEPLVLPESTTAMSLWVWGANHDYTIEAHLADCEDEYSIKPLGSLRFSGWRRITLQFAAPLSGTRFVKFVVRTAPVERAKSFEIRLAEFTAITKGQVPGTL